jgi:hypothetical protein
VAKKFGIQYFSGNWWIAFDSEWVGYFPEDLWKKENVSYSRSGLVQMFGEVAAQVQTPCTDMGNGQTSEKETAARVASVAYVNGPTVAMTLRSSPDIPPDTATKEADPEAKPVPVYTVGFSTATTTRSFRYGGPGVDGQKKADGSPKCS